VRSRRYYDDDDENKMDLNQDSRMRIGFFWLRIGTVNGLL
jgi:hypothetical protein